MIKYYRVFVNDKILLLHSFQVSFIFCDHISIFCENNMHVTHVACIE